jgi:spore germination protein
MMVLTPFDETGTYRYDLLKTLFTNPAMRDRLINNIVLTVLEKGYYGVVFNFGYIAPGDKDQFIITVSKTSARLNARGALVIVTVVPGVNDEGIDYIALGKAANFVDLRPFRWEAVQEPPAAVTSVEILAEMLAFIIARIDSSKILLGLPNYGLNWMLPHVPGESAASMVSNIEALELAESAGAEILFDQISMAPYYRYTNGQGNIHEVWFEDMRSMRAKLELVNQFDLAGVSIWTIMDPFPAGMQMLDEMFTVYQV